MIKQISRDYLSQPLKLKHRENMGDDLIIRQNFPRDKTKGEHIKYIFDMIKPNQVWVDGGAHIGTFCLRLTKQFGIKHILAVEPNPITFSYLKDNVEGNNEKEHILTVNGALSEKDGTCSLSISKTSSYMDTIIKEVKGRDTVIVPTVSLSNLTEQLSLFCLKLDIEGGEQNLLLSMDKQVLDKVEVLSVEYHFRLLGYSRYEEVIAKIKQSFSKVKFTENPSNKWLGYIAAWKE